VESTEVAAPALMGEARAPALVPRRSERVVSLEGLRGVAAALVVVDHTILSLWNPVGALRTLAISLGSAGVCSFFLISGYVIYLALQSQRTGKFVFLRIFRLYPVSTVVIVGRFLLLLAFGMTALNKSSLLHLGATLSLFGSFVKPVPELIEPITWTVTVEMAFYIVAAAVFAIARNGRTSPSYRRVSFMTAAFLLLMAVANLTVLSLATPYLFTLSLICRLVPVILVGAYISMYKRALISGRGFALGLGLCSLAFVTTKAVYPLELTTVLPYLGALAVFALAVIFPTRGPLAGRRLTKLGSLAYPMYFGHPSALLVVGAVRPLLHVPTWVLALMVFGTTVWIASFIHRTIEMPMYQWARRLAGRRRTDPTAILSAETPGAA
jgi:peptidoglycan/LPS O-acetylase OafA/YrhL